MTELEKYKLLFDMIQMLISVIIGQYLKISSTLEIKDIIIRNYLSRCLTLLLSIYSLWERKSYEDAWILFRSLLDRLIYIEHLGKNDLWRDFNNISFKLQYEYQNKIRSDTDFPGKIDKKDYELTKSQRQRYSEIVKMEINWNRPDPKAVLKRMGLDFLYEYGYYFGSGFVHPIASDGFFDFERIIGKPDIDSNGNPKFILNNSIITGSLIIQESLNYSKFKWMALVYKAIEEMRSNAGVMDTNIFQSTRQLIAYVKQNPDYKICSE